MTKEYTVAAVGEILPGTCKQVEIEEELIGIYNIGGKFYAIHDLCSHAHAYLSEGTLEGCVVTCPLHGAQFDVTSGKNLRMPAVVPVQRYAVKVVGDEIKIIL